MVEPTRTQQELADRIRYRARQNLANLDAAPCGSVWRSKRTGIEVTVNHRMEVDGKPEVQVSYTRDGRGWLKWLSLRGFLRDYERLDPTRGSTSTEKQ